jgi:hypothetical protein
MNSGKVDRELLIAFALGRLSPDEAMKVLSEVEKDPALSAELEEIVLLNRAAEDEDHPRAVPRRPGRTLEPVIVYSLRAAAALVLLFVLLVGISETTKDRYHDLARVGYRMQPAKWRGEGDAAIQNALNLAEGGRSTEAIRILDAYAYENPPGEEVAVVHLMIGTMMLEGAERGTLHLFPSYDTAQVHLALQHLARAMISKNPLLLDEAHYLKMKALLMLGLPSSAILDGQEFLKSCNVEHGQVATLLARINQV